MEIIKYYAWAENAKGQIEQLLVERAKIQGFEPNPHKRQTWTGRIFKSNREAATVTQSLNCPATR